jgi:hypothetical protein
MKVTLLLSVLSALLAAAPPAASLELGNGHSLAPRASFTDQLGQTHTRFDHYYRGLRVWGSDTISHSGPGLGQGRPALPRLLARTPGTGTEVQAAPLPVDLTLTVPLEQAQQAIRQHLGAAGGSARLNHLETVLYPEILDSPALPGLGNAAQVLRLCQGYSPAYQVQAEAGAERWEYLVDAHSGAILERLPLELTEQPVQNPGQTLYSGKVTLDTLAYGDHTLLVDQRRTRSGPLQGNAVTDLQGLGGADPGSVCALSAGEPQVWGDGRPEGLHGIGADSYTVAADAAFGLQNVWDYFHVIHGWEGWDG